MSTFGYRKPLRSLGMPMVTLVPGIACRAWRSAHFGRVWLIDLNPLFARFFSRAATICRRQYEMKGPWGAAMKTDNLRAGLGAILGRDREFGRDNSGASAVEFALIVPFLLFLVVGLFQFGITINNYLELTDGVRAPAVASSPSSRAAATLRACRQRRENLRRKPDRREHHRNPFPSTAWRARATPLARPLSLPLPAARRLRRPPVTCRLWA